MPKCHSSKVFASEFSPPSYIKNFYNTNEAFLSFENTTMFINQVYRDIGGSKLVTATTRPREPTTEIDSRLMKNGGIDPVNDNFETMR